MLEGSLICSKFGNLLDDGRFFSNSFNAIGTWKGELNLDYVPNAVFFVSLIAFIQ